MISKKWLIGCMVVVWMMVGCSVDHSSPDLGVESDEDNFITGMALAGGPIVGHVYLKSEQSTNEPRVAEINENGSYKIELFDYWTGPYILEAKGTVGGRYVCLHTLGTRGDVSETVNITPLTELVTGNLIKKDPKTYFEDPTTPKMSNIITEENLTEFEALIRKQFKDLLESVGVDTATYHLLNTNIQDVPLHSKADVLFDFIRITGNVDANGDPTDKLMITNLINTNVLVDDLTDELDNQPPDIEIDHLKSAEQHITDILNLFGYWESLFENGAPSSSDEILDDYNTFKDFFPEVDFIYNGYDREEFLDLITETLDFSDISITNIGVEEMDLTANPVTAIISFKMTNDDDIEQMFYNWHIESGATIKIKGNQQLLSVNAGPYLAFKMDEDTYKPIVILNGIYLYAYAPVVDAVADVVQIDVTGPYIDEPLQLKPIEEDYNSGVRIFTHTVTDESYPQGFCYLTDPDDNDRTYVGTDNSEYVFNLKASNDVSIGEYTVLIPCANRQNDYYDTLEGNNKVHHVSYTYSVEYQSPDVIDLKTVENGSSIDVEWTTPENRSELSISFKWSTGTAGSETIGYESFPLDNAYPYKRYILGVDVNEFDIYIRTIDKTDLMIDTFISKKRDDEDTTPKPITLFKENRIL